MSDNKIVLFKSSDGEVALPVEFGKDTAWLTRMQMAELFGVTPQNITLHMKNVYASGELDEGATSKESLLVQMEGGRQTSRMVPSSRPSERSISRSAARISIPLRRRRRRTSSTSSRRTTASPMATSALRRGYFCSFSIETSFFCAKTDPSASPITRSSRSR